MRKNVEENNEQLKILDKITDNAAKQLEKENKNLHRNYFIEWFRYVELVSKKINKYLN